MSDRGILVINFGGPQAPEQLVPFLTNLLTDVLPLPRFANRWVAPTLARRRAGVVGKNYAEIGWSPLVPQTEELADVLAMELGPDCPPIAIGMMFSEPSLDEGLRRLRGQGVTQVTALGLFPHESFATSRAAYALLDEALPADMTVVKTGPFYADATYIRALAETIRQGIDATPGEGEGELHLLFSPHGLPESFVRRGDPYPKHIERSVHLVLEELAWTGPWHLGWQSRVGPVKWLEPSTTEMVERLGARGVKRLTVVPISFVCEGIETLHELDIELAEEAHAAGITHLGRAPALGATNLEFIRCLRGLLSSPS